MSSLHLTKTFAKINEFEQLRKLKDPYFSTIVAKRNGAFNRYSDILAFDKSRVELPAGCNNPDGYINANYITSLYGNARYIAAQGPLPSTISHFWQMIMNEQSRVIVMLTPLEENGRIKCEQYWPAEGEMMNFADIGLSVCADSNSETSISPNLCRRVLSLSSEPNRRTMTVELLHFEGWPDHSGSDVDAVMELIKLANEIQGAFESESPSSVGPMVVHCSAGVGRTGTLCSLDSIQKDKAAGFLPGPYYTAKSPSFQSEIQQFGEDVIAQTVNHFRHSRTTMVQSITQYKMIHDILKKIL